MLKQSKVLVEIYERTRNEKDTDELVKHIMTHNDHDGNGYISRQEFFGKRPLTPKDEL